MSRQYNDPVGGTDSDIGHQFRTDYYQKKALIEAAKEQYFGQMADVVSMPKHMGKTIRRYHYLPMLDDRNISDQGLAPAPNAPDTAQDNYYEITGTDPAVVIGHLAVVDATTPFADAAAAVVAWNLMYPDGVNFDGNVADSGDFEAVPTGPAGNLYGSSKDIGTITGKMPALSETGGRVNRVGFTRRELEGSIEKFGFFDEYTQESLDFDTDAELDMHINREMIMGANEITEDALQIDLINSAGVTRYGGDATSLASLGTGTTDLATGDVLTYTDLMKLSIDLDNNRCPKNTKLISGTRMIDTKVIYAARYMYIGSELIPTFRRMVDLHSNPAFIAAQHYAAAGNTARGEIGSVDQFRLISVPEMMHHEGGGAVAAGGGETVFRTDGVNYNAYPALVVGSESFTTIGFQTNGKTVKFKITHKKPGRETADRTDPYGENGFMSIKWYYGFMLLRPERLAVCWSLAEW